MRVSDTERQRALDELRRHCRAGRLDIDEYGRRVEEAAAATTLSDLDHALRDLPMVRIDDPLPPRAAVATAGWVVAATAAAVVAASVGLAAAGRGAWAVLLFVGWLVGLADAWLLRRR